VTTPDWQPTFDAVHNIPGSTKQQPAKKTPQAIREEAERNRRRQLSDVAVAMGGVITEDDDPFEVINTQWNLGGQSTAELKRETDSIAAGLAQLQADVKANNNSGKSFIVPVSDYGTSFPTVFTLFDNSGSGAVYNDGNTLQMSNNDGRELFSYNVEELATDYFETSLIVPTQSRVSFGSYANRALFFIGRADATFDNYCFARLNGNSLRIGAVIDGVSTIDSPTWFGSAVTISPGVYMTFTGGTLAGAKVFQFKVNNQVRATFTDSGDDSLIGADYRRVGCGIRNDYDAFLGERGPSVSHFVANDNAPAPVVGTFGHMYRTSTSQVGVSAGQHELPSGFFAFRGEVSEDLTANESAGTFTITKPGPYTVSVSARTGTSWVNHFTWILYVNGLVYRYFPMPDVMWGSNALGGTIKPELVGATMTVHLYEGDVVSFGYDVDGTAGSILRGEAAGAMTYASISGASPSVGV
jgi:hypothetical protein